jgi:hypothetical protein
MLLEFTCSNHKSIRKKIIFSALAGKDTSHEEKIEKIAGLDVLKSAVIYGANGSGKSNLVDAIDFVRNLVLNSILNQPGQGIRQSPHKLDGFEEESRYQLHFVVKEIRYVFGFSLKNMVVVEEYLYYFPNGKQTKIFERTNNEFTEGSKFRKKFETCKDVLMPNRLMLSCAANFSNVDEVKDVFNFFSDYLIIYKDSKQDIWMDYSLHQIYKNENIKNSVLTFLKELDTGIKDINVTINEAEVDSVELLPFLSDEFKKVIAEARAESISTKIVYDEFETDLMSEESTGIKKLFGMLCPIIDIMVNGKVLICDELEANLHEALVYGLIKLFVSTKTDKTPQLIFTTHETGLLNFDLFRRDQIWFTEMKKDRSTDLFSLAEIKNVRREEKFGNGYITGKYGAIPMLNLDFAKIVDGI